MEKVYQGNWFRYFPDNYLWSHRICGILNLARVGGSALWEVDQIGNNLKEDIGNSEIWFREWKKISDFVFDYAKRELESGHVETASGALIRSAVYLYTAEQLIPPDDPRKFESYKKVTSRFYDGMKLRIDEFEKIEIPYEEGPLYSFWIPPDTKNENYPVVVFFDGADACKEITTLWAGLDLRSRGIGCLCIDGPGQGETLRLGKIPSRYDYEVPATAAYNYVSSMKNVHPERIGIMGMSMGGYYAPRAAAFEKRYAACVAWGCSVDIHEVVVRRRKILEAGGTETSAHMWQLPFLMGCDDVDSAIEKSKKYNLTGIASKITMPILILNGIEDTIAPIEMAYRLFEECSSIDKQLKIFSVDNGGSQHCIVDNLGLASNYIADWFMDHLVD